MFITINQRRLRNAQFLQFMRFIEKLIQESGIESMLTLHSSLKENIDEFEIRFKSSLKNPLTANIQEEDRNRDRTFKGFSNIIEGNRFSTNEDLSSAAELLQSVINNHGKNITRMSMVEETAVLTSLINEIESSEPLMSAINTLFLPSWLHLLKTYNQNCENLLKNRAESIEDDITNLELRGNIFEQYKTITKLISAHITLNNTEEFIDLKDNINKHIKEFYEKL
jgi:hypothetical protein